jgi:phosphoribosylglycinamide formyltransferase-1
MIVALCSGQGRTFEAVVRILGSLVSDLICDRPDAHVLDRAQRLKIRSQCVPRQSYPDRASHEAAVIGALNNCSPFKVIALLGYMRVLSPDFLDLLKSKWPETEIINLHPAPLSLYKGAHGLKYAIQSHAPRWGVSVHRVVPELDSGPLLSYRHLEILPTDTFETLRERAHPLEVSAVLEAIDILTRRSSLS